MHTIIARRGLAASRSGSKRVLQSIRNFSASSRSAADDDGTLRSTERRPSAASTLAQYAANAASQSQQPTYAAQDLSQRQEASASALEGLSRMMTEGDNSKGGWGPLSALLEDARGFDPNSSSVFTNPDGRPKAEPYSLHVYSTRHNTHLTFTRPNGEPIVSKSGGNLGFKHSNRGSFDAAYQLALNVFETMRSPQYDRDMQSLRIILRGFGQGREAFVKAFLGQEGGWLKHRVVSITDSTRLKFGGTRSKKPRRLG